MNGTTCVPKSVPHLVVDKVTQVLISETRGGEQQHVLLAAKSSLTPALDLRILTPMSMFLCAQACNIDILLMEWMVPF